MTRTGRHLRRHHRRGSVVFIVIWTIAIAALIASAAQLISYRQATVGRLALERVQARWAARGGIESTLAVMSYHTQNPVEGDARAMVLDMDQVADGDFLGAVYDIRHRLDGLQYSGPRDEHAKLNINTTNSGMLLVLLDDLTLDVADAITDWMDADDEASLMGVESDYYISLNPSYEPRNGPLRTLNELELVAGIFPEHLRGEDWNLNGRLDINENDTHVTLPYDNQDNMLDAGWSEFLTASTVAGGATASGLPRLFLRTAEPEQVVEQVGISDAQARSLIYYSRGSGNTLEGLASIDLSRIDESGEVSADNIINPFAAQLTEEELLSVIAECTLTDPVERMPGRMNVNSVPAELLRRLMESLGGDEFIADEIIYLRQRPEGITNIFELQEIQGIEPALFQTLYEMLTTSSNVFTINSRGRSAASGVEVEIIAVVDRSALPIRIIEYREQ